METINGRTVLTVNDDAATWACRHAEAGTAVGPVRIRFDHDRSELDIDYERAAGWISAEELGGSIVAWNLDVVPTPDGANDLLRGAAELSLDEIGAYLLDAQWNVDRLVASTWADLSDGGGQDALLSCLADMKATLTADTTDSDLGLLSSALREWLYDSGQRYEYVLLIDADEVLEQLRDSLRDEVREELGEAVAQSIACAERRDDIVRRIATWVTDDGRRVHSDRSLAATIGVSHTQIQRIRNRA